MAKDEVLTDDFVASLLTKDAKDSSIKYSSLGLEAFSQSKLPANKPKPNTRFLRNIIKDTDSHNAALLAKEAAESRERLRSLGSNEHREGKASRFGGGDIRRRQLGDIAAILGGKPTKRKRTGVGGRRVNTSSDEEPEERPRAGSRRSRHSREDLEESGWSKSHKSHHRRHRSTSEDREKHGDDQRRRHRSRSRSPREHRSKESRRDRSPRKRRSRSSDGETARENPRRSDRERNESDTKTRDQEKHVREPKPKPEPKPDYDSDPLDDIIGPRPPPVPQVQTKGRGTISHASGIDARFSADYDPAADVQLDFDEENDWDQALEALRDRQRWKQQGADRLRAAGFTEEEIKKWEKSGEKREEDVTWAKQGQGREWDRGKVLDNDGVVSMEPQFGRLKGT